VAPSLRRLPATTRRSLRRRVEKRLFPPLPEATLDEDSRARLESLYGGEIERLRALTGKDFATWSV